MAIDTDLENAHEDSMNDREQSNVSFTAETLLRHALHDPLKEIQNTGTICDVSTLFANVPFSDKSVYCCVQKNSGERDS